jgi:PTS system nitrogen regulatory IIA component
MMLESIIKPDSVLCNETARSKKHSLEIMSELLTRSNPEIASEEVFAKLIERERLGCTTLDKGIAFPHCRIAGLANSCGALLKLVEPVDFDAIDGDPVDLIFGLIVPGDLEATNYTEIVLITDLLRDRALRSKLRAATSSRELYNSLIGSQDIRNAAQTANRAR